MDFREELRRDARRRFMRKALLFGGLILLVVAWLASSALMTRKLTRRTTYQEAPDPPAFWQNAETLRLNTNDGEELGAWFVPGAPESVAVLFLHGKDGSRASGTSLLADLVRDGHGILAPTLRAHGDSTGSVNDFGWSARQDVIAAVELLELRRPRAPIVIVGSSMGAVAAIFAAEELKGRVAGYVLEAPYRDLASACRERLRNALPPVVDAVAYLGLRVWAPVFLSTRVSKIRPIDHVGSFPESVPVVFLVGTADRSTPVDHVRELSEACSGDARFVAFAGAGHEGLYYADTELYLGLVREVLSAASSGD